MGSKGSKEEAAGEGGENEIELTEEMVQEYKMAFAVFDTGNRGEIKTDDLGKVMESMGMTLTPEELEERKLEVDADGDGTVDRQEFIEMMAKQANMGEDDEGFYIEAFMLLDEDRSGVLDKDELRKIMVNLGEHLSPTEIEDLLDEADTDGDREVDYFEFVKLLGVDSKPVVEHDRTINTFLHLDDNGEGTVDARKLMKLVRIQESVNPKEHPDILQSTEQIRSVARKLVGSLNYQAFNKMYLDGELPLMMSTETFLMLDEGKTSGETGLLEMYSLHTLRNAMQLWQKETGAKYDEPTSSGVPEGMSIQDEKRWLAIQVCTTWMKELDHSLTTIDFGTFINNVPTEVIEIAWTGT